MAAVKPRLSRQYCYFPLAQTSFDLAEATVHQVALLDDPTVEPEDEDWMEAIVVTDGHDLYVPSIGNALALLIGPDRGDEVTTHDLAPGQYLAWSDIAVPTSDERLTDWHGAVTVVTSKGTF